MINTISDKLIVNSTFIKLIPHAPAVSMCVIQAACLVIAIVMLNKKNENNTSLML